MKPVYSNQDHQHPENFEAFFLTAFRFKDSFQSPLQMSENDLRCIKLENDRD
jgi:hypothetical protein